MGGEKRPGKYGGALLPAGVVPEQRATPAESGVRRVAPRTCRVLLVEDEDMVRKVLTRMLSARGFDVKTAASVSEAQALFESNEFELLITDVNIPLGSGHALARSLVERNPALRVLFVSGYSGGTQVEGLAAEQVRFLTKPFGSSELTQMIQDLLPPEE